MGLDLELIRLPVFTRLLLVADLHKDKLAQLAKRGGRGQAASAPEGLMTFFDGGNQFSALYGRNVGGRFSFYVYAAFIKTELLGLSVRFRQVGDNVLL